MLEIANELQKIYRPVTGSSYHRRLPKAGKNIADSLNNGAVSLLDLGKQEEALKLWNEALKIQPHHPESTYNRGLTLWRSGKIADGTLVKEIEEMRKSHEADWIVDYLLGLVHLERDDCEAAIKTLEGVRGAGADRDEIRSALALARERLPYSRKLLRTFGEHAELVTSVCLTEDGRYALSGSMDKMLKLWEVATGRCLHAFEGHKNGLLSICLSQDGRFALSAGSASWASDNLEKHALKLWEVATGRYALKLWEVATGRCLRNFKGHIDEVRSICLSRDERFALSGSNDKTLKLWEVATGRCLRTFRGHKSGVQSVCLSQDGRYALSGSEGDYFEPDNTLKLWEVESGRCLRTFEEHKKGVSSVCLSQDGKYALSVGSGALTLWEVATGRCLRTFQGPGYHSVYLSPDGRYALSGLQLWEVATGRCLRTFDGHMNFRGSVYLNQDWHYALSGCDKALKLWGIGCTAPYLAPMILCRELTFETAMSTEVAYESSLAQARVSLANGDAVTAAHYVRKARSQPGYGRRVEAMDAWAELYIRLPHKAFCGGWEETTFEGHKSIVTSVCLSLDRQYALSGSHDRTLKLWDVETGRCLHTFEGHKCPVSSVCLSQDGRYALSGGEANPDVFREGDGAPKLWEVATGRCLRTFQGHYLVTSVCLSQDGQYAMSGEGGFFGNKSIKLWDVTTGRCLRTFEGYKRSVTSICLSPDGRYALSGSGYNVKDKTLKLWDIETGRCLRTFDVHKRDVTSICLSSDGRYALSAGDDNVLILWEVATGYCLRTFEGGVGPACLSLDGRYALSGSDGGTLKLWDVATGRCLYTFGGHKSRVTSVCLSPDGRYAISGSCDDTLKLWKLDWELEDRQPADWDEGARPYLETFLTLHTPYAATLPKDRKPSKNEITLALTRQGKPTWSEGDFKNLLYTLGCAGYGWLRPEGVRRELEKMAADWKGLPPLPGA
jgi:WD40 repeat protein